VIYSNDLFTFNAKYFLNISKHYLGEMAIFRQQFA